MSTKERLALEAALQEWRGTLLARLYLRHGLRYRLNSQNNLLFIRHVMIINGDQPRV